MSMLKLDELIGKKKDAPQVLDLSRSVVKSQEDFKRLMERVPEYKIRPEKVRLEDTKGREKKFTFKPGKREILRQEEFSYANPIPPDMRAVKIEELSPVAIDWKMLTSVRPKLKLEEEMFSRLVAMGKLSFHTTMAEKRSKDDSKIIKRNKNRAGILETRALSCKECGEEFCSGVTCSKFLYDCFIRECEISVKPGESAAAAAGEHGKSKIRKKKKKKHSKQSQSPKRKKKKTKIKKKNVKKKK